MEIDIRAMSGFYVELAQNAPVEYLGAYPMVALHRRDPRLVAFFMKRVVDILLSLSAILVLFPIMLVIAIAVLVDSRGPVFYVSERIGKRGRVFPCFKFRTMVRDAEAKKRELTKLNERDSILFKMAKDPRVTRVGRILRKYSLDELPQFFNVLRGEMSIVGPRPPIASEVAKYALEHFRRLEVLPGVTGLWQVQARSGLLIRPLHRARYRVCRELELLAGLEDLTPHGSSGHPRYRELAAVCNDGCIPTPARMSSLDPSPSHRSFARPCCR